MSFLKNKFLIVALLIIVGGLVGFYFAKSFGTIASEDPQNINPAKVGEVMQKLNGFTYE